MGWHSLTLPQDPKTLVVARRDMLAAVLATGLDPERSIIFHQDEVSGVKNPSSMRLIAEQNPNHTDLAWVFNCITPVGKLRRMTTWKVRCDEPLCASFLTGISGASRSVAKREG